MWHANEFEMDFMVIVQKKSTHKRDGLCVLYTVAHDPLPPKRYYADQIFIQLLRFVLIIIRMDFWKLNHLTPSRVAAKISNNATESK